MPAVQFSGLASGLNTSEIIAALVGVERIPIQRLEAENSDYQSKISIIDSLSSALSNLKTKAEAVGTTGEFLSYKGEVGNEDAATLTASGDAVQGTYSLEVVKLATSQRSYSNTVSDKTAALSGSDETFSFTIDGETTDIALTAGETLEDLVGKINASGAEVTAGLFYDGTDYRLQVVGNNTGTDAAITFSNYADTMGLNVAGNQKSVADDAHIRLDGFDIYQSTNTFDGVLDGVTLEVEEETTAATTITIEPDKEAVKGKLSEMVEAYNSVVSIINQQSGEGKGENTLNGDSTVRMVEQQLQQLMSTPIPGLTDGDGNQMALSSLGFETRRDGGIDLDDEALEEALASNFADVATYFVGDGTNDGMSTLLSDMIDSMTRSGDGLLTIRKNGINDLIDDNNDKIASAEEYLASYEDSLRQQYTQLETTMSALQSQQQYLAQYL